MPWVALGTLTRRLAEGETVVGGGADADWRVTSADLMPRHVVLTVHGLNTSIRPMSDDVVVAVNGKQLGGEYHLLNDGDEIAAGRGRFVYTDDTPRGEPQVDEPAEIAYLVDEAEEVAYLLRPRSTTLGRDVSNSIVTRDPTASRFHAEVRREAGGFALHSMGAAGTTLNGRIMTRPVLLDGDDVIQIAFTTLRFVRGPLAPGISIAPEAVEAEDSLSTQTTVRRGRATIESSTDETTPPGLAAPIVVAIGVMVLGTIIVALAGLAWVNWGR